MNIGFLGLLQPGGLTQLSNYLKSREMHEVQWYLVFRMFFVSSTRYQDALILISRVGKMAITPDFDFLSLVFSDIAEFENAAKYPESKHLHCTCDPVPQKRYFCHSG